MAARAIEPRCTALTVGALEVGFAHTASQTRVLPAGITLGSCSVAVTVHYLSSRRYLFSGVIVGERGHRVAVWKISIALGTGGTVLSREVGSAVTAAC